jgi:hypothetical protein
MTPRAFRFLLRAAALTAEAILGDPDRRELPPVLAAPAGRGDPLDPAVAPVSSPT